MRQVSDYNLKTVSAFYIIQVSLSFKSTRLFKAYCKLIKCTTLKPGPLKHILNSLNKKWLVVFCCATTSVLNIKVIKYYFSVVFTPAFNRFTCEVSYLRQLLPAENNQLVKACESMNLNFENIKLRLTRNANMLKIHIIQHNIYGKVVHKVNKVKRSIKKTMLHKHQ